MTSKNEVKIVSEISYPDDLKVILLVQDIKHIAFTSQPEEIADFIANKIAVL
jgi:hypothetical protein